MSNQSLGAALGAVTAGNGAAGHRLRRAEGESGSLDALAAAVRGEQEAFRAAMPSGRDPLLLISDVIVSARRAPELLLCDVRTVLGAAMTFAQLGLRIGVLGHGWIVANAADPTVAQPIVGYKGLRDLAMRSGLVLDVTTRTVHERDFYDPHFGTRHELLHQPSRTGERGAVTDYYAVVRYPGGGHDFETMSVADVRRHRDKWARREPGPDGEPGQITGAWASDFDAMACKTCFRALAHRMPQDADFGYALAADGLVRVELGPEGLGSGYVPAPVGETPPPGSTATPQAAQGPG